MITESMYNLSTEAIIFIIALQYYKSNQTTLIHSSSNAQAETISYYKRLIKTKATVKPALQKPNQSPIN